MIPIQFQKMLAKIGFVQVLLGRVSVDWQKIQNRQTFGGCFEEYFQCNYYWATQKLNLFHGNCEANFEEQLAKKTKDKSEGFVKHNLKEMFKGNVK